MSYVFFKTILEHDLPSWEDEIAEPRPDMNIEVTALTVTQKLYNIDIRYRPNNSLSGISYNSPLFSPLHTKGLSQKYLYNNYWIVQSQNL